MSARGCDHLQQIKKTSGILETIRWIHLAFIAGSNSKCLKIKIFNSYCRTCKKRGPFLHSCLECVYFGCFKHIRTHMLYSKHTFSMDLIYGQVHCNICKDYIYDAEIENILLETNMNVGKFKKRLFSWTTCWDPTKEEREILPKTKRLCILSEPTLGLRGLYNLGDTCFINCSIQTLMHMPLLRDYFLTETHTCNLNLGMCFVCIFSNLFQDFYRNSLGEPLALIELLQLTFLLRKDLAYGQQDPHEFLMFLLNELHSQLTSSITNKDHRNDHCSCIVDKIFTFKVQSDIVCQQCQNVSTTYDICKNISLDLISNETFSLEDCLRWYTRIEDLSTNILCEHCNIYQKSTKQLKISTLPVVISFQLKRFYTKNKVSSKIIKPITFPDVIDLTPYISKSESDSLFPSDNRYYLISVISHYGKLEGGHHYAYVRQQPGCWYKCTDDIIISTDMDKVFDSSEAYLLFYHKQVLDFS